MRVRHQTHPLLSADAWHKSEIYAVGGWYVKNHYSHCENWIKRPRKFSLSNFSLHTCSRIITYMYRKALIYQKSKPFVAEKAFVCFSNRKALANLSQPSDLRSILTWIRYKTICFDSIQLTVPLFIEGRARRAEGVPNEVRSVNNTDLFTTRYACNAPALWAPPL